MSGDNPQTEVDVINDTGAPLPVSDSNLTSGNAQVKIKGNSDGALIGNISDALKVTIGSDKRTYSANVSELLAANSPTDIFAITGAANTKIEIIGISFSATKNNTGFIDLKIIKRSTANSGGTSTTLTNVPHDSADAASMATVRAYTANPTLGTAVGEIYSEKTLVPSATANSARGSSAISLASTLDSKPITLRSASEVLAINLNGMTAAGISIDASITWVEESI